MNVSPRVVMLISGNAQIECRRGFLVSVYVLCDEGRLEGPGGGGGGGGGGLRVGRHRQRWWRLFPGIYQINQV